MTDAREYLYWIGKNCPKADTSVIYANIHDITSHTDAVLTGPVDFKPNPKLGDDFTLKGIFLSKIEKDRVSTMVYDGELFFLIDNCLIDGEIKSKIWYHPSPIELVAFIPEDLVKYLNLKQAKQALSHLSKKDKELLLNVLPLDFLLSPDEDRIQVFKKFAASLGETMDLSMFYTITPSIIESSGAFEKIETIVLNHNEHLTDSFSWLPCFPNLKVLTVWNTEVTDNALNLKEFAPKLTIVEFHYCSTLTGRCIINLSRLPCIDKIVINNEMCTLQETTYETVIKDEEWKQVKSDTLTTLFINSGNLTLDFIDFCLKSFKGLSNFIMHDLVLQKLEKNSRSGHSDDKISFHSATNINAGFYRYADVKITDLVRYKIGPAFSESMLRKIREIDPSKAAIIEGNLGSP